MLAGYSVAVVALFGLGAAVSAADLAAVQGAREGVARGDPRYAAALAALVREADGAMGAGPFTVTAKRGAPPSGDRRDYQSFGSYWWPDPTKADGLPYVRRDGELNKEMVARSDRPTFESLSRAVQALGWAGNLSHEDRYLRRAAVLLRHFFLDPATGMRPNLLYAQGIPGISEGRGIGIIDINSLPDLLDAVAAFESAASPEIWSDGDRRALRVWMGEMLEWLQTHEYGRQEMAEKNNHGVWYDAITISLASYLGDKAQVAKITERARGRIRTMVRADGALPLELPRTRSYSYSMFTVVGYVQVAERARRAGLDLWHEPAAAGSGSLSDAAGHILGFTERGVPWPQKDLKGESDEVELAVSMFLQVRSLLDRPGDAELRKRLTGVLARSPGALGSRDALLYGLP